MQDSRTDGTTIGETARAAGVGVETIRFYQRRGLIAEPPRPPRGARRYAGDTVRRIRFIRQAQELGFSLGEIGELLSLRARPDRDCAEVQARAERKLIEVEDKMTRLVGIQSALRALIIACPGAGPVRSCSILDALGDGVDVPAQNHR